MIKYIIDRIKLNKKKEAEEKSSASFVNTKNNKPNENKPSEPSESSELNESSEPSEPSEPNEFREIDKFSKKDKSKRAELFNGLTGIKTKKKHHKKPKFFKKKKNKVPKTAVYYISLLVFLIIVALNLHFFTSSNTTKIYLNAKINVYNENYFFIDYDINHQKYNKKDLKTGDIVYLTSNTISKTEKSDIKGIVKSINGENVVLDFGFPEYLTIDQLSAYYPDIESAGLVYKVKVGIAYNNKKKEILSISSA